MEKSPVKQTVFFIVILVASTHCMIKTVNVIEGDVASLNFTYLCNSTEVTIQRGNAAPFYSSSSPTPPPSSSLKLRSSPDGIHCFLYLIIDPVTRDDQGGYILTAYKDDTTLLEDDRIQLWVKYPPGKASCSYSEEHIDQEWVRLQCTAPLGNSGGFIMCYQNGMKIAPLNSPQQHDETLSQTLLAKIGDLVYCCSCTVGQTKDRCECKDSVWDPIQNEQVTNVPDPCPPTVPIQYPTFSQHSIDHNEFELTSPSAETLTGTPPQITYRKALVSGLIVVTCLLIMVIVSFIVVILYFKKKQMKPTNCEEKNGVQESFISESASKV